MNNERIVFTNIYNSGNLTDRARIDILVFGGAN